MKRTQAQDIIESFKAKAISPIFISEFHGKIIDTPLTSIKLFNARNESIASLQFAELPTADKFIIKIGIGHGMYECDNYEIAKSLLNHIE